MLISLHKNAATTPRQRAYIQASTRSVAELALELGVCETTIRRWKGRRDTADRACTPHRIATSLSLEEEEIAVELRQRLTLSIDDATEVMQRCVRAAISRSAIYRLWLRRGIAGHPPREAPPSPGRFDPVPFGYVHVDLKHLTRLDGRPAYVFVAIERATRFVHVDILDDRSADTVAKAFARFLQAFGHPVHTVLTDNGSEFTDRFGGAFYVSRDKGTGRHAFDQLCAEHRIAHKLTKPYHPQTNGMVERFNRRLADAIRAQPKLPRNRGRNSFASHDERNAFIRSFVDSYNRTRLKCLDYQAPAEHLSNLTKDNTKAGALDFRQAPTAPACAGAPIRPVRVRPLAALRAGAAPPDKPVAGGEPIGGAGRLIAHVPWHIGWRRS